MQAEYLNTRHDPERERVENGPLLTQTYQDLKK
jgi:hypothetical protein